MSRRIVAWMVAPVVALVLTVVVVMLTRTDRSDEFLSEGSTVSFVVPLGSAEALRRGELLEEVFPPSVTMRVGDWLEVVNDDVETHRLGPVVARAGETARVRFYEPGRFDAECSVGHDVVTIEVLPR